MDIDAFIEAHPMLWVHLAYSVVWALHLGFVLWIAVQFGKLQGRRLPKEKKTTEPEQMPDSVVPRSHA